MASISVVTGGEVKDVRYKKVEKGEYLSYLGDTLVGHMLNRGPGKGWSCFGYNPHIPLINGLLNRYYCTEYLLKAQGYWRT